MVARIQGFEPSVAASSDDTSRLIDVSFDDTIFIVIKSFRGPWTEAVFNGESPKGFPAPLKVARRKLEMLNAAAKLADLRSPPSNRLER